MDPNVLCSEDQRAPAVCCCFCRFPLPSICSEHLSKHPIDTELFQHFHLPLSASQIISTKEIKSQFDPWLYKLYRAISLLKDNADELARFEEQIQAAKAEAIHDLETEFAHAKQKIAKLREAFATQLQTAIRDVSAHAMEQWIPEGGSLASLIWNFDARDPGSLKMFRMWVGRENVSQIVKVFVETSLPYLAHFNQYVERPKEQVLQLMQLELAEVRRSREELQTENAKLKLENEQLLTKCSQLSENLSSLADSSNLHINRLIKEKETIQFTCTSQIKRLKLKILKDRNRRNEEAVHSSEEIDPLPSEHSVVESLQKSALSEKAAFHYQKSASLLQQAWSILQQSQTANIEAVSIGTALSEVLGLNLGKFTEAETVIDDSIRIATRFDPISDSAMKLWNLKAAIYLHSDRNSDCEAICAKTIQAFSTANLPAEQYWTAVYCLIHALYEQDKYREAETVLQQWVSRPLRNENELSRMLKLCARGYVACMNDADTEAEKTLREADRLASAHFPTSVYAATNLFLLGWLFVTTGRPDLSKSTLFAAHRLFSVHFPNSIYSASVLIWLADVLKSAKDPKGAVAKRRAAHMIFREYHSTNINTGNNLNNLALLYKEMGRVEKAERTYLKARKHHEMHHPTSNDAATNLYNLGQLYLEEGEIEKGIECAKSAVKIWSGNESEEDVSDAEKLLRRLRKMRN